MRSLRRLRLVWESPRPPELPAFGVFDYGWAVVAGAVWGVEVLVRPELRLAPVWTGASALLLLTVIARRRLPLAMAAIAAGARFTLTESPLELPGALLFLLTLPHALVRWGSGREVVLGAFALVASAVAGLALESTPTAVFWQVVLVMAAMTWGLASRLRASAEAMQLAQVQLQERTRLARELHDTVAHHVSAIAIRAQAGQALVNLQSHAVEGALTVVAAEARRGLEELQNLVRASPGAEESLFAWRELTSRGPPKVTIESPGELRSLDPSVSAELFRLAREAVTNARRHARNVTRIEVVVENREDEVVLTVTDDGTALADEPTPGFGMTGMRERAELLGGECTWSRRAEGGLQIRASLPKRREDA